MTNTQFKSSLTQLMTVCLSGTISIPGTFILSKPVQANAISDFIPGEQTQDTFSFGTISNDFELQVPDDNRANVMVQALDVYLTGFYRIKIADKALGGRSSNAADGALQVAVTPPPIFEKSPKDASLTPALFKRNEKTEPNKTIPKGINESQIPVQVKKSYISFSGFDTGTSAVATFGPGLVTLDTSEWPTNLYGYLSFREAKDTVPEGKKIKYCSIGINYPFAEYIEDGGHAHASFGPACKLDRPAKGFLGMTLFDRHRPRRSCEERCKRYFPNTTSRPAFASLRTGKENPFKIFNARGWREGYRRLGGTIFPTRRRGQSAF